MKKNLTSPSVLREILDKHGVFLTKKYGQNFLIDENILNKIIGAVNPLKDDNILEVGPGIGTLTLPLAQKSRLVATVEIDTRLLPVLRETLDGQENINIINKDIMKVDLKELYKAYFKTGPVKVAANLPYYVTTPFLFKILNSSVPLASLTFMVQREAAKRITAKPGSKDYGVLTLLVQYYCKPSMLFKVPASVFFPRPEVESAVVSLMPRENPAVEVPDEKLLFNLIRAAFQQRRKTLVNAIEAVMPGQKELIKDIVAKANLSPKVRGEELTLQEFAILSEFIYNINGKNS